MSTTTLTDEIYDLLKNDMMFYQAEMFARIITSKIEKRIDESKRNVSGPYILGEDFEAGVNAFYKKVKEMLK